MLERFLSNSKKVAVIGAGLGGLSSTAHLLSLGYDVTVFESYSNPGGRARKIVKDGFPLECGPTVFTMLDVASQPFEALNTTLDKNVNMLSVDPSYRAVFSDDSSILWPNNKEEIHSTISTFSSEEEADRFDVYVKWLKKLVDVEYDAFIARNFTSPVNMIKNTKQLLQLLQMGAFQKMDKVVGKFLKDQRLIDLCSFQSLYAGVTPQQALGVYCVISYMDLIQGVYAPEGGMSQYPEALAATCINAGAKIHYDANVDSISKQNNQYKINVNSSSELFDAVVCNADLPMAYPEIFGIEAPKKATEGKYSPSCLLYVVGAKSKLSPDTAHHNIHFSSSTNAAFRDLVDKKVMMDDPSYLVSIPTVTDPSLCADDSNIFYVLEPCPNLDSKEDFADNRQFHKQRMQEHLKNGGYDISSIECEIMLDPLDWQNQKLYKGTPFSLSHTFMQSGPYRLKNYNKALPGVFFAGTATTPGVGIPMVIESGRLSALKVKDYFNNV